MQQEVPSTALAAVWRQNNRAIALCGLAKGCLTVRMTVTPCHTDLGGLECLQTRQPNTRQQQDGRQQAQTQQWWCAGSQAAKLSGMEAGRLALYLRYIRLRHFWFYPCSAAVPAAHHIVWNRVVMAETSPCMPHSWLVAACWHIQHGSKCRVQATTHPPCYGRNSSHPCQVPGHHSCPLTTLLRGPCTPDCEHQQHTCCDRCSSRVWRTPGHQSLAAPAP